MFAAANRPMPRELDTFLDTALEDLAEIPTRAIIGVFLKARQENENVSPPSNGKILAAFRIKKTESAKTWVRTIKETMQRRLDHPEHFTPEQLEDARDVINGKYPEHTL